LRCARIAHIPYSSSFSYKLFHVNYLPPPPPPKKQCFEQDSLLFTGTKTNASVEKKFWLLERTILELLESTWLISITKLDCWLIGYSDCKNNALFAKHIKAVQCA